jgi:hypothetical protein
MWIAKGSWIAWLQEPHQLQEDSYRSYDVLGMDVGVWGVLAENEEWEGVLEIQSASRERGKRERWRD